MHRQDLIEIFVVFFDKLPIFQFQMFFLQLYLKDILFFLNFHVFQIQELTIFLTIAYNLLSLICHNINFLNFKLFHSSVLQFNHILLFFSLSLYSINLSFIIVP